jgi:hypothetical protein
MSVLNHELGSHDSRQVIRLYGSFQANGTSDPDLLRDGKTALFTGARTSAGLFTITFASGFPIPERLVYESASLSCAATLALKAQQAHIVRASYSQTARTVQIVVLMVGDVAGAGAGTVTCTTKANYADTDFMTIGDGLSVAKVYEFDTAGDGVTAGRVQVDISGATTAAEVAAILRTAILANQPALSVTDNADGTLTVTHNWPGHRGEHRDDGDRDARGPHGHRAVRRHRRWR